MATEKQIEAALDVWYGPDWRKYSEEDGGWRRDMGAAIDAAEAAAWSDNMSDAPMDRRILVEIDGAGVLAWTGDDCWPDGAQRWREIPALPAEEAS